MIAEAIKAGVTAYVVDGLRKERVKPILDMAISRFNAFSTLERELREAKSALAERKIIDRAKGILMRQKQLTEEQAYGLLRSAAILEQTFGGLTANLWDDPFEWTLPETLSTPELISEYLAEVNAARQRAFASISGDNQLTKYISVPSGEPQPLFVLLIETLVKAGDYRGRAVATHRIRHKGMIGDNRRVRCLRNGQLAFARESRDVRDVACFVPLIFIGDFYAFRCHRRPLMP